MRITITLLVSLLLPLTTFAADPKPPQWGQPKNGLRTRLIADKQNFRSGEAIPMRLEAENVGNQTREFQRIPVPHYGTLKVLDEAGKDVPFLVGLAQVQVGPNKLDPGHSRQLESFDLAEAYYLRKPGRYTVQSTTEPASAPFEFEVIANPDATDGDAVGRLLPLLKKDWWLNGGSLQPAKVQPGKNRVQTTGRLVSFQFNPTGYKLDSGLVWLWLADEPAAEKPADDSFYPATEYLGKIANWHVYFAITPAAEKDWPTAKEDIAKALKADPK